MTRSSMTLAVAVAALAFAAPSATASGAPQTAATSSPVAAIAAVAGPGSHVPVQRAISGR